MVLLVGMLVIPANLSAAGVNEDEQFFLARINQLRASRGLNQLQTHPELTAASRHWAERMAADDDLKHAPDIASGLTADWEFVGENVGMHFEHDLGELFQAFIDSPDHLENLVEPSFTHVGVGVRYGKDGKVWTTHRFMKLRGATPQPKPTTTAPAPATTAAPAPTTATQSPPAPQPTSRPPTIGAPAAPRPANPPPSAAPRAPAAQANTPKAPAGGPTAVDDLPPAPVATPQSPPGQTQFGPELVAELLAQLEQVGI